MKAQVPAQEFKLHLGPIDGFSVKQPHRTHLYGLPLDLLRQEMKNRSFPVHIANQIYLWVYKKWDTEPVHWTNISKDFRKQIAEFFDLSLPTILWQGKAKDGTRKFLIRMNDGQSVETVAIPSRERLTLCISSQVGCAIGCKFCHTGTQGLKRHLKAYEIVGQFIAVQQWLNQNSPGDKLTNIVFMGQGEPLHNFDEVKLATQIFLCDQGIGIGQRKITLSTSGLVPQIRKLVEFPPVNFAISLHSARNEIRSELMPINKVYDLQRLFEAIKSIPLKAHRRITYEYLLIKDLNHSQEDVLAICNLIPRQFSKINLIPFNEYPASHFKRPSEEEVNWFCDQLIMRGYTCTIRATKGHDILAACGQLKSEKDRLNIWDDPKQNKTES